ncbi:hypothetical protein BDK51DRAFT_49284 [Blyttiomyces helicus]|uniref:RRM domain-containing protein n=1 Tax=Blyttiomyces helicus TaxID=388810 RepID=A0A4P9VWZ2_9FUNG|nr:hypothetical protein BDK51DRAFT_49284 [Blyttiomyces helicus]|eukprot:RKO84239.1 hypothetical protein BDK51DRAFT_49284 [Blyttiomyces helicus]
MGPKVMTKYAGEFGHRASIVCSERKARRLRAGWTSMFDRMGVWKDDDHGTSHSAHHVLRNVKDHVDSKRAEWTVLVSNLPFNTTDEDLEDLFSDVGIVEYTKVVFRGKAKNQLLPGYASIAFLTSKEASDAVGLFNKRRYHGSILEVQKARKTYPGGLPDVAEYPNPASALARRFDDVRSLAIAPLLRLGLHHIARLCSDPRIALVHDLADWPDLVCIHAARSDPGGVQAAQPNLVVAALAVQLDSNGALLIRPERRRRAGRICR